MRILLLDDEASHRLLETRAIKKILPQAAISECATVDEAARLSAPASFELAIIDLNIAGHSGLAIVELLRKHRSVTDLPVLVLSTSQLPDDIFRSYRAGASGYLFKSDDPAEFTENLQKALQYFATFKAKTK